MRRLWLEFSYPWLLLLIIPAIALVLIPYFRTPKKFRRTRNKITTVVLQLIVMVLSITVLSGLTVHAEINNKNNKVLFVVDVSDTEETAKENRDKFVYSALNAGKFDKFDMGIVTFGYDQIYAVPFTDKANDAYDAYLSAEKPDTTATDIAAALSYAADLFPEGSTGKIVLVTDGKQTDENALSVIRAITAKGITVDAVNIKSGFEGQDVRVSDVALPGYHVGNNELLNLTVTLSGSGFENDESKKVTVTLYDNGVAVTNEMGGAMGSAQTEVGNGDKTVDLSVLLSGEDNLHRLEVKITSGTGDAVEQNDVYTTYYLIEKFDRILILERGSASTSDELKSILTQEGYVVKVVNVTNGGDENVVPATVDELRQYDQVILNNISNADLTKNNNVPDKFVEALYSYVNDYGGGLLTTGGLDESKENANAYSRADMSGSLLQSMLPVQAINYTPPVAVMIIIDRSGSMSAKSNGKTYLEWAIEGAGESLNALSERDYVGIMTLDSDSNYAVPLTPMTQKEAILKEIRERIDSTGGGTVFLKAIQDAAIALKANKKVDKRHMIIITDGALSDNVATCESVLKANYESDNITLSVVGINISDSAKSDMQKLIDAAGGQESGIEGGRKPLVYTDGSITNLPADIREELNVPQIKEVNDTKAFYPTVYDATTNIIQGIKYRTETVIEKDSEGNETEVTRTLSQLDTPTLGRFFGVKVKSKDYLILTGDYEVPLYAQWKLGKGTVGSFMSDLQGSAGANAAFMESVAGRTLIQNIVGNVMPTSSVRQTEMRVELDEDNYTNKLSIFTNLDKGDYVEGTITDVTTGEENSISMNSVTEKNGDDAFYVTSPLASSNGYGRCSFTVRKAGVYKISLVKKNEKGDVLAESVVYKSFAYSKEYDTSVQNEDVDLDADFFAPITKAGGGTLISDPEDPYPIFENFKKTLEKVFDPRYVFMIIAIVLFVTEIAVRKFKFKWPHEIIAKLIAKRKEA